MSIVQDIKKNDMYVGLCGKRIYFKTDFPDYVSYEVKISDIFAVLSESMEETYKLADYQSQIKPINTDGMFKKKVKK